MTSKKEIVDAEQLGSKLLKEPGVWEYTKLLIKRFRNADRRKLEEGIKEKSLAKVSHALGLTTDKWKREVEKGLKISKKLQQKFPELHLLAKRKKN